MAESLGIAEDDWGELDGDEEPLFADDIEDDDDPPPLPPPMPSFTELSQAANNHADDAFRVNVNSEGNFGGGDVTANADGTAGGGSAKKKRKPLLILTPDRIFSEKGLPYLEREFPKLKFKGKGHEASDLKHLLQQYEHWANRLFPKLTCKDVTDRIENLARRKEFKTQLTRMRRRSIRGGASPSLSNEDSPELHSPPTHGGERTATDSNQDSPNLWDMSVTNGNSEESAHLDHEGGSDTINPVPRGGGDLDVLLNEKEGDFPLESPIARKTHHGMASSDVLDQEVLLDKGEGSDGGNSPPQSPRTHMNMKDHCVISDNIRNGISEDNPQGTREQHVLTGAGRGRKRRLSSDDDDDQTTCNDESL